MQENWHIYHCQFDLEVISRSQNKGAVIIKVSVTSCNSQSVHFGPVDERTCTDCVCVCVCVEERRSSLRSHTVMSLMMTMSPRIILTVQTRPRAVTVSAMSDSSRTRSAAKWTLTACTVTSRRMDKRCHVRPSYETLSKSLQLFALRYCDENVHMCGREGWSEGTSSRGAGWMVREEKWNVCHSGMIEAVA